MWRASLLGLLLLWGCGASSETPEVGGVQGVVTVKGAPLPNAIVTFTPEDKGRPSSGQTDTDGSYELLYTVDTKGARIGKHIVRIQLVQEDNADSAEGDTPRGAATGLPAAATDGSLVKEVAAGRNTINIEL